ncbi:YegS/Rv2252/BmrU family lipid kinase [Halobacillus shinanisalinarum]|uniref:YegS/Rv2252/BmrU family lipid kinase n=1 Tax=Halobacillus shinanisalinarum TaxID=2932258 RepID=A0ABY4GUW9_9BACI|nr:YegS/Rv2252/BmrU family lipid kinase [Halobacillus shinanisalinarum]UOQ91784.1 YegS/Rv2252/BmrU family lipid kinase [Halobacillus shinanisalinarum]
MPRYKSGLFIYNGDTDSENLEQNLAVTLPSVSQAIKELTIIQTDSLEDFKQTCCEYGPEVDILIILGGDGTLHECVNCLADQEKRPVIAVLPSGTSNDFSRVLGTPQNLQLAAKQLLHGEEVKVDIGKADNRYFINFWGIGLVTETSSNIDKEQKNRIGVLSYFISAFKTMSQIDPFSFIIEVDGEKVSEEAVMVLVMNGRFIGTREVPLPSSRLQDGKLDVLIVKNSNLTTFKELITMNKPGSDPSKFQELSHMQGEKIRIDVEENKEVDMDGEIVGKTPTIIKGLPNHFTFLCADTNVFNNVQRNKRGNMQ